MALARRPNGLRKNTGGCRIPTEPFSPNGLKSGWHHIPKNSLSLKAKTQMTSLSLKSTLSEGWNANGVASPKIRFLPKG